MTPITDKREMYRRLNSGQLGHTLPGAETLADAERLTRNGGSFGLRFKQAGGRTEFGLSAAVAMERVRALPADSWNLSPMLDDSRRVCYAHLLDGVGGWSLHYSTDPKPCKLMPERDGCKERHLTGLAARLYLQSIMDFTGWETLLTLVELYPDHVIEFTVMASSVDAFGSTNTIFWEVRCTTGEYERNSGWARSKAG